MGVPPLSDELCKEAVEVRSRFPTNTAAADFLGIARSTFCARYNQAAKRGMLGTKPVLPGFRISQTTQTPHGDFIQQKPEHGEQFEVPAGHTIKGISALVDPDNRIIQQWVKTREDDGRIVEDAIRAAFAEYSGPAALPPPQGRTDDDLLTSYPVVDNHLGMFSWAKETGADYDLKIGAELLRSSTAELVARSAPSTEALIVDMGDYFHGDNSQNRTMRSGNALDIDTRYAKVVQVGFETTVALIELALQKHHRVQYRKLPGNHDEETSLMLAVAIAAHFRSNERVSVDTSPSRFFMRQHGKCLVVATHGDMLRMGDLAGFAAAQWPAEWGSTTFRYGYTGHVHNEKALAVNTLRGMRAESFNTLAAKDAWHAGMGYQSSRNMVSITLHKERGEVDRFTVAA